MPRHDAKVGVRILSAWSLAVAVLLVIAVASRASDDAQEIFGLWHTPRNDGRVLVIRCSNRVCARIVDGAPIRANPDQRDVFNPDPAKRLRRVKGLLVLDGYAGGPTEWRGGTVYDPQTGDSSSDSTLRFVPPKTLVVEGCRFLFCRSESWTRISSADRER